MDNYASNMFNIDDEEWSQYIATNTKVTSDETQPSKDSVDNNTDDLVLRKCKTKGKTYTAGDF